MMMTQRLCRAAMMAGCYVMVWCGAVRAQDQSPDEQAVRGTLRAYIEAFNQHDAAAVGGHWAENAVYVDRQSGERVEGRAALVADFGAFFKGSPDVRLQGVTETVHFVTPDVAIADGTSTVTLGDALPVESEFSATLVRQGAAWKLHTVQETTVAVPESATDALQQLAWMVGEWVDDADGPVKVTTTVNWADGDGFLVRSFHAERADGTVRHGTQLIGWDPRAQEIRSWAFNADGSFGDGVWSQVGDAWHVRSSQTLADGDAASGTYVITPIDENTMSIQLIGHEIEGEPQPASPLVTVVRAGAKAAAQTPAAGSGGAAQGDAK